jgi:glycosyltransferase involved in cell wall biosynthesis
LTIVTPVRNGRDFISKCVGNVAGQGDTERIEHLVLDAASTDGTVEILDRLSNRWPHLRVISESDRGQSHALNKGARLARGSVIGILNVDDYYEHGVLPRVMALFENVPEPSFLVGNCNIRREDGSLWFVNRPRWLRTWQLLLGIEVVKFPLNPSAYFYHRSLHDLVGPYDEKNHYSMDLDFILRVAFKINLRHVDETWGNFCLSRQCKTMAAGESGVAIPLRDEVFAHHRAQLPPVQRLVVSTIAALSRSKPCEVLRFVVQRPDLAWTRIRYHLRRLASGK